MRLLAKCRRHEPLPTGRLQLAKLTNIATNDIVVHDAHNPDTTHAFALSRLGGQSLDPTVTGIFRAINRPTYDDQAREQTRHATKTTPPNLQELLTGTDTWNV